MKVGHVTDRSDAVAPPFPDGEEQERAGADLGSTGRLQLMAQLSEGEAFACRQSPSLLLLLTCALGRYCWQVRAFRCLLPLSRLCR